ncbi:hypothetical protein FIBSPDRAFT_848319 [Athelia psychrophila]|uniref:Uncharacterized protein n=1 Tax=Athelia psychrophila TaxID=1759441 RepID=A0A166V9R1_9AGAM|nr:hypothetical protein FIBSPDRAFT_848319 [Fibularhizoctonia sp. CBS 109695]
MMRQQAQVDSVRGFTAACAIYSLIFITGAPFYASSSASLGIDLGSDRRIANCERWTPPGFRKHLRHPFLHLTRAPLLLHPTTIPQSQIQASMRIHLRRWHFLGQHTLDGIDPCPCRPCSFPRGAGRPDRFVGRRRPEEAGGDDDEVDEGEPVRPDMHMHSNFGWSAPSSMPT